MTKLCPKCNTEKDIDSFHNNKNRKDGKAHSCRDCISEYTRELYRRDPSRAKFYKRNEDRDKKRDYLIQYKHGVSRDILLKKLEEQNGCAICGFDILQQNEKWCVDHDHKCCGKNTSCDKCRRGILCQSCNLMLGYAKDNLETLQNAILYLDKHKSKVDDGNT